MNAVQKTVLMLVRSTLTGEKLTLPDEVDLDAVYALLRRHKVVNLAYDGAVNCGLEPAHPVMQKMFQDYCRLMMRSDRQMQDVEKVCAAFDANQIDYMPVKGCNMKKLYPRPELRLMGDADILIRVEQYDQIRPVMEQLGFTEVEESDHELIWKSSWLLLELHKRLIPSYNKDYAAYYGDGWRLAQPMDGSRFGMKKEDEFIYLFTHFAKHYRDGGIGIRHVVDLWVYLRCVTGLDHTYMEAELEKLQLGEFYRNICRMLAVWFEDAASDEMTEFMGQFVMDSGIWGTKETHIIATGARNAAETGSVSKGNRRRILRAFFPNITIMQEKYPVLEKCPALLPVFWPVRWTTAVLFRRDNLRKQREGAKISSAENIENYQQALHYVGLDFRFKE